MDFGIETSRKSLHNQSIFLNCCIYLKVEIFLVLLMMQQLNILYITEEVKENFLCIDDTSQLSLKRRIQRKRETVKSSDFVLGNEVKSI